MNTIFRFFSEFKKKTYTHAVKYLFFFFFYLRML